MTEKKTKGANRHSVKRMVYLDSLAGECGCLFDSPRYERADYGLAGSFVGYNLACHENRSILVDPRFIGDLHRIGRRPLTAPAGKTRHLESPKIMLQHFCRVQGGAV